MLASSFATAQQATVPASFVGTYNLSFNYAQANSPLPNGATATMTITSEGQLCIADLLLTDPVAQGAEAIWTSNEAGARLAISNISTGVFNEINVSSLSNVWWGQFDATKVSNATDCGDSITVPTEVEELFALAQQTYASIFAGNVSGYEALDGYIYRHYPTTNVYLAVNNGQVYVMGGEFGDAPLSVGSLNSVLAQLNGEVNIPEGDYNLTVSGTVQTVVSGFGGAQVPFSVSIANIPAPDTSDIADMEDAIRDSLEGVGTLNSLEVEVIESTSSSIIFDVTFSATTTSNGTSVTSNYSLRYSYVRQ